MSVMCFVILNWDGWMMRDGGLGWVGLFAGRGSLRFTSVCCLRYESFLASLINP